MNTTRIRLVPITAKVLPLPVFSNVELPAESPQKVGAVRGELVTGGEILIGHFGRFMEPTRQYVLAAFETLLERDACIRVLLIGECGARYRSDLLSRRPEFASRVFDSGVRGPKEIATLIQACDLMFQPYPEGITTKRSSAMAALAQGRCVVSNRGVHTERFWNHCGGLRLLETLHPEGFSAELSRLALSPAELAERGAAASVFYHKHFSSEHTVDAILASLEDPSQLRPQGVQTYERQS